MTIADMRILLGLDGSVSDAAVVAAYAASLSNTATIDPEQLPVSRDDAKRQLRVTLSDTSKDIEIDGFIADAVAWVEKYTGHILVARIVQQSFAAFERLRLHAWPVKIGAAVTVTYTDGGSPVAVPGAGLLVRNRLASIRPPVAGRWPSLPAGGSVTVSVRAGYEPDEPIPGTLRRAMLVMIQGFDAGGEALAEAEVTARRICRFDRARSL